MVKFGPKHRVSYPPSPPNAGEVKQRKYLVLVWKCLDPYEVSKLPEISLNLHLSII